LLQSLLLMSLAWLWLYTWSLLQAYSPCWVWLVFITPVITIMALGMLESALMRRHALVGMYLKPSGWLYQLVRGGMFMLIWQIIKALGFGLFLFVEMAIWSAWVWGLLLFDVLVLWALFQSITHWLRPYLKPGYAEMFTRHYLVLINTALGACLFAFISFYMPHTNYSELSWQAAADYAVRQVTVECDVLAALARISALKEVTGWWVAQNWLPQVPNSTLAIGGWVLFFLSAAAFFWGFSRFVLGILVAPNQLLAKLDKSTPIG